MTLIATPGAVDANSFCTVTEALRAQIGRRGASAWASADPEVQEASLIQATQLLSLRVAWLALQVDPLVQALPLPMVGQVDQFGRDLALDIIPPLVVQATALYALALYTEQQDTSGASQGITQLRVEGDVTVTYAQTPVVSVFLRVPWEIWDLLRPYGTVPSRGRSMPVVRG